MADEPNKDDPKDNDPKGDEAGAAGTARKAAGKAKDAAAEAGEALSEGAEKARDAAAETASKARESASEAGDKARDAAAEAGEAVVEEATGWWRDLLIAARFLTILPIPVPPSPSEQAVAESRRAFALIGLVIGLIAATVYGLAHLFTLTAFPAALLALAAASIVTGGRAEKGLADFAEGLFQGTDIASRRKAVTDERLGYIGIMAIVFSVLLRASLIAVAAAQGGGTAALVAALVGGYTVMAQIPSSFPPAHGETLQGLGRENGSAWIWLSSVVGGLLIFLCLTFADFFLGGLVAILLGGAAAYGTAYLALRMTGGLTMPAVMAVNQAAQLFILIAAAANI